MINVPLCLLFMCVSTWLLFNSLHAYNRIIMPETSRQIKKEIIDAKKIEYLMISFFSASCFVTSLIVLVFSFIGNQS